MSGLSVQAPRAVVLIRPHRFRPNPQAGGSVRCMIAGVHLARRDEQPAGDGRFPGIVRLAGREEVLA